MRVLLLVLVVCLAGCSGEDTATSSSNGIAYQSELAEIKQWHNDASEIVDRTTHLATKVERSKKVLRLFVQKHKELAVKYPQHEFIYEGIIESLKEHDKAKERKRDVARELDR